MLQKISIDKNIYNIDEDEKYDKCENDSDAGSNFGSGMESPSNGRGNSIPLPNTKQHKKRDSVVSISVSSVSMSRSSMASVVNVISDKPKKFVGEWMKDAWNRKSCLFPLFTHLFDQMTDIGVIAKFYILYENENKHQTNCQRFNPLFLFIASIFSFSFYRIVSAVLIYKQTKKWYRFWLQMFDLEIYRALRINYKLKINQPTNPQRWIQSLEAMLEAFPQTMIQLYFCIRTGLY